MPNERMRDEHGRFTATDTPAEEETFQCPGCGTEIDEQDASCEDCFRCDWCGSWYDGSDGVSVDSGELAYCGGCTRRHARTCTFCGETWSAPRSAEGQVMEDTLDWYCAGCAARNCYYCSDCDAWYASSDHSHDDDSDSDDDGDGYRRPYNTSQSLGEWDGRGVTAQVHHYGYKPRPLVVRAGRENRPDTSETYGIELEIGTARTRLNSHEGAALEIARILERNGIAAYMKEDGSLGSCNGIEIVTHPYSRRALDRDRVRFVRALVALSRKRFDSHNNGACGLHVHVGRAGFESVSHEYRFARLFIENVDFWRTVSRRTEDSWSSWCAITGTKKHALKWAKGETGFRCDERTGVYSSAGHYHGLNMSGQHTVEVRVFRGTLNPLSFFGALELIRAAFDYAKTCGYEETTRAAYMDFLTANRARYVNAVNYLHRRGNIDVDAIQGEI